MMYAEVDGIELLKSGTLWSIDKNVFDIEDWVDKKPFKQGVFPNLYNF